MKKLITASSKAKTYDKQGLVSAIRNAMQAAHAQSEFRDCKLNMHSLKVSKYGHPVKFKATIEFTLEEKAYGEYTYDSYTDCVSIWDIPMNTEIPDNYYTQNPEVINRIISAMRSNYITEEDYNQKRSILDELIRSYKAEVSKLEDKYDVELKSHIYPSEARGGHDDYMSFTSELASVDRDDFYFTLGTNSHGVLTDRRTGSDIKLFISSSGSSHHYLKESSDAIIADEVAKLEEYITRTLDEFRDTLPKLRALSNNEHVVESFLQQFTQKYASQYPGLHIDYESHLDYARLSVVCDPNVQFRKEIDYPCSSADYTKWTKSILGMLKRRRPTDPERYSSDSELITL